MDPILSKDFLENGTVEVRGNNGAFFRAFVVDVEPIKEINRAGVASFVEDQLDNIENQLVMLRFEDDWQPKSCFSINRIRLPPPLESSDDTFEKGDEVEVLTSNNDQDARGWWPATVQMHEGAFYVVYYINPLEASPGNENNSLANSSYQEIVSKDRIRRKNPNDCLKKYPFFKFSIPVTETWNDVSPLVVDWLNKKEAHSQFKQLVGAVTVEFDIKGECLTVIGYTTGDRAMATDAMRKSASMLSDLHLRNLKQKAILLMRTDEVAKQLESTRIGRNGTGREGNPINGAAFGSGGGFQQKHFFAEFTVPSQLMGLAIGTHGNNIQNARKVEGVIDITLDEGTSTFRCVF